MLATTKEVADALRVRPATVMRMVADGRIPAHLICRIHENGPWRFNLKGIEEHMLAQTYRLPKNP